MKEIKIYDDEKNETCSSCSAGSAKTSSRKRSWHFVFIIFALALIFALLGLVDLKSNAAESYTVNATFERTTGTEVIHSKIVQFHSTKPIEVYIYTSHDAPASHTEILWGHYYLVSESQIDSVDGIKSQTFTKNGKTFYIMAYNISFGPYGPSSGQPNTYYKLYTDSGNDIFVNTQYATSYDFAQAYINDSLDVKIDYDLLEVDSSLPLIENVLANKISNKTGVNSGGHSVSAVKEYYDYITWKNTGNYDIQVERYPIVKLYEGTFSPKFLEDFEGDFYLMEILSAGNSSFTYQVDLPYIESNYPNDYSFLGKITTDVAGFWDTCELYYGYRLRYVDGANNKASCWTYVIPEQSNIKWDYIEYPYYSYVEYVDGSLSDNSDATGSSGEYDSLDDIDNAKNELDNENAFKDKYDILVGDVGTQEATNWLYSVVNFVKSTPNVVGSVLGFLPTPIRSGVFVVIFLGVISSGLAIIRALI